MAPKRNSKREVLFPDFPEFRPNLTPKEMFQLGSFGGTYWRPIKSKVTGKRYENVHRKYPKSWWVGLDENIHLTRPWKDYDQNVNLYNVKVGTTLEFWEEKAWITHHHPYGWVQWYCDFYLGKRSPDDEWQVKRWLQTAGPKSRFRLALINQLKREGKVYNDVSVSPKRRQTLQHWGYKLSLHDYNQS